MAAVEDRVMGAAKEKVLASVPANVKNKVAEAEDVTDSVVAAKDGVDVKGMVAGAVQDKVAGAVQAGIKQKARPGLALLNATGPFPGHSIAAVAPLKSSLGIKICIATAG